jgi:hypothetical protein
VTMSFKNRRLIPLYHDFLDSLNRLKSFDLAHLEGYYKELMESALSETQKETFRQEW